MTDEKIKNLKKYEETIAACNRCGFCTSYCPTYNVTGNEIHSPRGRNQIVRGILEGKITSPLHAKESIDTCLLCGECTSICFSEVPTAEIMVQARHYLQEVNGIPIFLSFFLKQILARPVIYYWFLKISFLIKRLGIVSLLKKFNLLQKIAPTLSAADDLMPHVPLRFLSNYKNVKRFLEKNWAKESQARFQKQKQTGEEHPDVVHRPKVALLPICGSQYLMPEIGVSLVELLKKLHTDFIVPNSICCGLPAASYGVLDQVHSMAQENIRRLEKGHYDSLLVDDSSCGAHIKDYPKYLQKDPRWMKRAHDLSEKVIDISQFLIQKGLKDHLKMTPWEGGLVAFHDPCKAQYAQKLTHPPRELLLALPRIQLVSIPDADQCCGGGGTYSFVHPELSQDVLKSKISNIIQSGSRIVVTSSASCLIQLRFGLKRAKSSVEAMHITSFLLRALEKRK